MFVLTTSHSVFGAGFILPHQGGGIVEKLQVFLLTDWMGTVFFYSLRNEGKPLILPVFSEFRWGV
jgi:hypothetical protein